MEKQSHFIGALMLLRKDEKILLIKRSANSKYEPGKYTLPSGTKEPNETALMAAIRETKEEVGINIDPKNTKFIQVLNRKKPNGEEWIDFFFSTEKWQNQPQIMEPDKHESLSWFKLDNVPENTIEFVKEVIQNFKNQISYSEVGY